jgi:hypothetical protein
MAPVVFIVSVVFFPFLMGLAFIGLLAILPAELTHRLERWTWLRFLCGIWFVLFVPTFGLMPLSVASRLYLEVPMGEDLMMSAGITLSAIYSLFAASAHLHPRQTSFPPLSGHELYAIGLVTLAISTIPAYLLVKTGRSRQPG